MRRLVKIILPVFWVIMLAGCDDGGQDRKNSQLTPNEPLISEYCEGNVTIKMGSVTLSVPRMSGLVYNDADGTEHRYKGKNAPPRQLPHPYSDCSIKEIGNPIFARVGPSLYNCSISPDSCETTYQSYRDFIESAKKDGHLKVLSNGIFKTTTPLEIYFLPQEVSPTGNGEPVTLMCSGQEKRREQFVAEICYTRYINTDGLGFGYQFFRNKYSEDEYLSIDNYWRKRYESIKIQK